MSNFKTNTKNILKKFNKDIVEPKLDEKADKSSTYTKEEVDNLIQNNSNSGSDNSWVQEALDTKVDKTELEEYKAHTHEEYATKNGYKRNRLLMSDANGKLTVKDDILPTQLDHLANVTSDIQEQLLNRSTLDHKHEGLYVTREDLDALDQFSGLAQDVDYNNKISSTLNSTNVQGAIDEIDHKVVNLAHTVTENKNELDSRISEVQGDVSTLTSKKLDKEEVGVTVAQLEGGKLKKSQLPEHTHTDYIPHEHDQYALKTDVSDSFKDVNDKIRYHSHEEFSTFAKTNHTHKEFEDLAGSHTHPEFSEINGQLSNISNNVRDNSTEITKLWSDKANTEHKHQDLIDRLDAIDVEILDHTHTDLVQDINTNKSDIATLRNGKADKDHLDSHLGDLDKRYSKVGHTHDFSTMHDHDDRYAKINHDHFEEFDGRYADIVHNHNDIYAEKVHYHSDYANKSHNHSEYSPYVHGHVEIDELRENVDAINVNIESLATKEEVVEGLATKSDLTHTHNYEELENIPEEFNPTSHTHSTDDVDGLMALIKANKGIDGIEYPELDTEAGLVVDNRYYYGDVRRYGAINNNTTCDLKALKNAWTSCKMAIIPANFKLTVGDWLEMPKNTKIVGEDKETSVIRIIKSSSLKIKTNSNTIIRNLTIDKSSARGGYGISIPSNTDNTVIEDVIMKYVLSGVEFDNVGAISSNVVIKNCEMHGYDKTNTSSRGIDLRGCDNLTVENTVIDGFNSGIYSYSSNTLFSTNTKIDNCKISNNITGIYLHFTNTDACMSLTNCKFEGNETIDIDSTACSIPQLFVKDCYFKAYANTSIAIDCTNIVKFYIENCVFKNYDLAIKNKEGRKIESNKCHFVSCKTEYQLPNDVIVYENILKNGIGGDGSGGAGGDGSGGAGGITTYPALATESGLVVNAGFYYGDIRRYGGQRLTSSTIPASTNNHTAIQNAFKSVGYCYIPSGEWVITSIVTLDTKGALYGDGMENSILSYSNSNIYIKMASDGLRFEGLGVRGVNGSEIGYGFYSTSSSIKDLYFKNVKLSNVRSCGIYVEGYATGNAYFDTVHIINTGSRKGNGIHLGESLVAIVENCFFYFLRYGVYFYNKNVYRSNLRHTFINNNFIDLEIAIYEAGANDTSSIHVASNIFRYVSTSFYSIQEITSLTVTGNQFLGTGQSGTTYGIDARSVLQLSSTSNAFAGLTYGIYNLSKKYGSNKYNVVSSGDVFGASVSTKYYTPSAVNVTSSFV